MSEPTPTPPSEPRSPEDSSTCALCGAPLVYCGGEWRPPPLSRLLPEQLEHHHRAITHEQLEAALARGEKDREALEAATPRMHQCTLDHCRIGLNYEHCVAAGHMSWERAAPAAPSSLSDVAAADLRRDVLWREALEEAAQRVSQIRVRYAERATELLANPTHDFDVPVAQRHQAIADALAYVEDEIRALASNASADASPPPATSIDTFTAVPKTISVASQVPPSPAASELNQVACGADPEEK